MENFVYLPFAGNDKDGCQLRGVQVSSDGIPGCTQRLVCLKYSNQGDDYIREELRKLKEGLCCRPANMRNRMFSARIRLV